MGLQNTTMAMRILLLLLLCCCCTIQASARIPSHPLAGGGQIPMLGMGGYDFAGWFKAAGAPAMIQTFHGYNNGAHLAPQIQAAGRENVFVSTGIPCGCCGSDGPAITPMTASLATGYIQDELSQLNTSYVDLLLFHHRCRTAAETAAVWTAFEAAKRSGVARHIGVSNFNTHDLKLLTATAVEPIEVLEAHFGVGVMDFEALEFTAAHNIHPVAFASRSELSTDLPTLMPAVTAVAQAHNVSTTQVLYSYINSKNVTVLSSYDPTKPQYLVQDLQIFDIHLTHDEISSLDKVTAGKRSCPDCFTFECQACAQALLKLNCPIGPLHGGFVWGRSNPQGMECVACAGLDKNKADVMAACGDESRGESIETLVPKACGI